MAGAKRSYQLQVCGTAYPAHVCTEVPGKLNRCSAHAAGSAIDEYFLTALEPCFSEEIQRGCSTGRYCSRFIVGQPGRLQCHPPIFRHALVLRITTHAGTAKSKNLVTDFEFPYAFSD